MRSVDMQVGEAYALTGHRPIKVTVLETPPALRRQARVRVRFESGVMAGEIGDVLSRRIASPWDGEMPHRPSRHAKPHLSVVQRDPQVGDAVTWAATAGLVWSLTEVDAEAALATIDGVVFDQPTSRTVPMNQLRVHVELSEPHRPTDIAIAESPSPVSERLAGPERQDPSTGHLRPVKPRRALDELLDDVLFSEACLRAYRKRYASSQSLAAAGEQLLDEIRRRGFIMEGGRPGSNEYARLRVLGRFDVVLDVHPTPEQPITVEELHYPHRGRYRQANRQSKNRRRRAA